MLFTVPRLLRSALSASQELIMWRQIKRKNTQLWIPAFVVALWSCHIRKCLSVDMQTLNQNSDFRMLEKQKGCCRYLVSYSHCIQGARAGPSSLCSKGGSDVMSRLTSTSPPVATARIKVLESAETAIRKGASPPISSVVTTSPIDVPLCSIHETLQANSRLSPPPQLIPHLGLCVQPISMSMKF